MDARYPTTDVDLSKTAKIILDPFTDDETSSDEEDELLSNEGTLYSRKSQLNTSRLSILGSPGTTASDFLPVEQLGRGSYATATKFVDSHKNFLTVKKPHYGKTLCKSIGEQELKLKDAKSELSYLKRAYPLEGPYAIYQFAEMNMSLDAKYPLIADWRIIAPYIEGVTLLEFCERATDPDLLAIVVFNAAVELERIHKIGVIHGDISLKNIIVTPDYAIHYIDFDFSYENDPKKYATTTDIKNKSATYFAPERVNVAKCLADPNQDVYSLAYALSKSMIFLPSTSATIQFHHKYSCIVDFIEKGLSNIPQDRQPLTVLIENLETLTLTSHLKVLLMDEANPDQAQLLETYLRRYPQKETLRLLYSLCEQKQYESAQRLLDFQITKLPHGEENAMLALASLIIEFGTKLPKFTGGHFQEPFRRQIIAGLKSANKLMEMLLNQEHPMSSDALIAELSAQQILADIHELLCKQGYLAKPASSSCCIL